MGALAKGWAGVAGWLRWVLLAAVLALVACSKAERPVTAAPPPPAPKPAAVPPPAPKPPPIVVGAVKPPEPSGGAGPAAPSTTTAAMPSFAWPPPKASAVEEIPEKWLRGAGATTLGDVADKLEKALRLAEHGEWSYYAVPGGFALATHLEQIRKDGSPLPGADRWKLGTPSLASLTLKDFVAALASAPPGQYRAIVFVVTDVAWRQSASAPGAEAIQSWAGGGAQALPAAMARGAFGPGHHCHALVYQFRKVGKQPASYTLPSALTGQTHLEKSGLWRPLSIL